MLPDRTLLLKAFGATLLFASVPACVRAMDMDSYALGIWRLGLATVGMSALVVGRRTSTVAALLAQVRREWRVLAAVGVAFGLHWLTFFQSIKIGGASIGTLGFSTCGVQLPLLGWLFGFGRPRLPAMIGVALAMIGSLLCVPVGEPGGNQRIGLLIGVLSGTLYAVIPLLHQRHARLPDDLRTWAQFAFGLPVFLVLAPAARWSLSSRDFWYVLYLGLVVNLIGHFLWVQICTVLPLATTSALGYLQLPVSLALNAAALGERHTPGMLAGAALILAGNALTLRRENRRQPLPRDPPLE